MSYKRKIQDKNRRRKRIVKNLRTGKYTNKYHSLNSQCLSKKGYASEREAMRIAEKVMSERGKAMRIYECSYCEYYHLTHKDRF